MRTIVTLFVAVFVAVGAVFLAPAVEGQVSGQPHRHAWDFIPGGAWVHPVTGASMITYGCAAENRTYDWVPGEDSTVTVHVKVMAEGQRHNEPATYHSRNFSPQQPQECDLRKGLDVVTFELRNSAGTPVYIDWSLPRFQDAIIAARSWTDGNLGFTVPNNRVWRNFPGTRTGNARPVTGQSDFDLLADPGERYEDVFGVR